MTDIITNVIGGIIGYVIYLIFRPLLIKIYKKQVIILQFSN